MPAEVTRPQPSPPPHGPLVNSQNAYVPCTEPAHGISGEGSHDELCLSKRSHGVAEHASHSKRPYLPPIKAAVHNKTATSKDIHTLEPSLSTCSSQAVLVGGAKVAHAAPQSTTLSTHSVTSSHQPDRHSLKLYTQV